MRLRDLAEELHQKAEDNWKQSEQDEAERERQRISQHPDQKLSFDDWERNLEK